MALNCIGLNSPQPIPPEMGLPGEPNNVPSSSQSKRGGSGNGKSDYEMLDPEIATKIRVLEQAKEKAVSNEHFEEA